MRATGVVVDIQPSFSTHMAQEHWERIENLYHAALEREPSKRELFLREATAGDEDLLRKVKLMLEQDAEAPDSFLKLPTTQIIDARIAADRPSALIGRRLGPFEIIAHLGSGGWGEVYRARDSALPLDVALKILRPSLASNHEFAGRFRKEARLASSLNHPNIVAVRAVGHEPPTLYIAMELIEGHTLHQLLQKGALPIPQVLELATQLAAGLTNAHEARIMHRDLKPQNVMISHDGVLKILDFGLGKQVPAKLPSSQSTPPRPPDTETISGMIMGTVDYMSPQQARGERVDFRSDQFSLGSMLYEMVSGRRAFHRGTAPQTMTAIIQEEPERLANLNPEVPEALEAIIHRCLSKDPADRFASTSELWEELDATRENPRREWTLSLPVALAAVEKQVAVLPFANIGNDPANQPFCDGLVEVLTSKLSQLEQFQRTFRIVPASEVRNESITSAREAAKAFGVALVVTGSMQRAGDRVRLTINLVDPIRVRQLKTKSIDAETRDISILQDGVVLETCQLLGMKLTLQEQQILSAGGTTVPGAYEFYLQGKGYLQRYEEPGNLENAIALFLRALESDKDYALARASLGDAYWRNYELTKDSKELQRARENCEIAVRLNDRLAPVHVTLGTMNRTSGKYVEAITEIEQALQIEPMYAEAYRELASTYLAMGKIPEAEATFRRAIAMRPSFWGSYNELGAFYFRLGRYPEAETQFRHVLELTPDNSRAYNNLGSICYTQQRYEEAAAFFEKAVEISPKKVLVYSNLGTVYFAQGRYSDAARAFERAVNVNDRHYQVWRNLGSAYHWAPGERHKAREAFRRAVQLAEAEHRINPQNTRVLMHLADCYSMLGEIDRARELLQSTLSAAPPQDVSIMFNAGMVSEQIGEREQALTWIGKALRQGYSRKLVEDSPSLAKLRTDPRYMDLLL